MRLKMNDYERSWNNSSRRWVYVHREAMERKLGRKLQSGEHIHHIDGDPKNNSLDNLELTDHSTHMSVHSPVRQRQWRPVHAV